MTRRIEKPKVNDMYKDDVDELYRVREVFDSVCILCPIQNKENLACEIMEFESMEREGWRCIGVVNEMRSSEELAHGGAPAGGDNPYIIRTFDGRIYNVEDGKIVGEESSSEKGCEHGCKECHGNGKVWCPQSQSYVNVHHAYMGDLAEDKQEDEEEEEEEEEVELKVMQKRRKNVKEIISEKFMSKSEARKLGLI